MQETDTKLLENKFAYLLSEFGEELLSAFSFRGDLEVRVAPKKIRAILQLLKERGKLNMLMDLFGMDYLKWGNDPSERFAIVYNLYSMTKKDRLRLKVLLPESSPEIDSIHDLFRAANWFEREAWDMFGVVFRGHPNLTRILCHGEFVGHPLRKDYPADQYQRLKASLGSKGI